ncbi:pectinesterase-like [Olea europaea subsp. europaea]|uniref:Pectinesterase n=2 Tax=Olea europaea subsp. europaea TaxID=158383 RepID=A0A8S0U2G1_OLEEU|nr:pectinesterase-like [Olea europaea subsp. europaea]
MDDIFRPKSKLISLSCLSLVLFLLFLLISHMHTPINQHINSRSIHIHKHIQVANTHCQGTLYPELCVSTLSTFPDLQEKSIPEVISALVNVTRTEVLVCASNATDLRRKLKKHHSIDRRALDDCLELFSDTVTELKTTLSNLAENSSEEKHYTNIQTLLSAAMTNQYTCLDGFAYSKNNTRRYIQGRLKKISMHLSNSLALLKKIKMEKKGSRNTELFDGYGSMKNGFPVWLKRKDRALLRASVNQTQFDLVVAKDGSGNFTTINEALSAAPNNRDKRFVIHIRGGTYYEYVEVERRKSMIMFVGDGIGKTLIKGNRNVADGWTTFRSSTVAVVGSGFIAKGITFENYAGPGKHQAVALRSSAEFSAFYQCSFVGYQDTLYVHSFRQFYRECDIYGTVDYIFGNAAVVIQNSNLYARKPNGKQKNTYTAQGRDDSNQNTGISILNCKVAAASDLIPVQSSFRTYLGRPWKQYSRTVYLLSHIGDLVEPAGWLEWDGTFALDTLYYGEYRNRGPGSNTTARVRWAGYRVINSSTEASQFTVGNFILGNQWLPATEIPFYSNLTAT